MNPVSSSNSSNHSTKEVVHKASNKHCQREYRKVYYRDYYKKNKEQMNRKRLDRYYLHRYTPEQRELLQALKPGKRIPWLHIWCQICCRTQIQSMSHPVAHHVLTANDAFVSRRIIEQRWQQSLQAFICPGLVQLYLGLLFRATV
jgi:hypothetical protein